MKLGFIDGFWRPSESLPNLIRWMWCDNMVICWILNSMAPKISEAFTYIKACKEFWDEISERFGHTNGPLLCQLKQEMINLMKENQSIASYYSKMK